MLPEFSLHFIKYVAIPTAAAGSSSDWEFRGRHTGGFEGCSSDLRIFNILSQKRQPLRLDDFTTPGHGFTCRRGGAVPFFFDQSPSK
jgi:hypothetical protein